MRRAWLVFGFLAVSAAAACVIGPKQDDPLSDMGDDAGFTADSSDKGSDDTASPTTTPDAGAGGGETGEATDASPSDGVSDASDALGDALGDAGDAASCEGGVPLTATPWNETGSCWAKSVRFFECVPGIDGGTALTCFAKISTGELFRSPTTMIPSGSDYRLCSDAEKTKTGTATTCP